jgi:chorismate lyase
MQAITATPFGRRWRSELPASVPHTCAQWLRGTGSLTQALQTLGKVQVQVGYEGVVSRLAGEGLLRGVKTHGIRNGYRLTLPDAPVWIRDVILTVDAEAVIAARSIVSARDSCTTWKSLRTLEARPLAGLLYHDSAVRRSTFAYASFSLSKSALVEHRAVRGVNMNSRAWARVSEFHRRKAPLVLSEIFLPRLWEMIGVAGNDEE